jgi:hypothetical protein
MEPRIESPAIECAAIDCGAKESMPLESACVGSPRASMSAGKPSQQISIENGRSLAGMNPGRMSARDANATSMMLARSVCLRRLRGLKRISPGLILGRGDFTHKSEGPWAADTTPC